jgi:uncharacterized protein (DUF1501 family)
MMSNKHHDKELRHGASLEHGKAHQDDHTNWTRRQFLQTTGLFALGNAFALGSNSIQALTQSPALTKALLNADNERVLVIIFMNGGNDGLNMIVPRFNSTYYNIRPTLAVQEANLQALSPEFGLTNMMSDLMPLWNDGKMAVVHSVAYPNQDYSHFRSTDIWSSGSAANQYWKTGWLGRYLDYEYPAYIDAPSEMPVAIQVGVQSSLVLMSPEATMGLVVNNPDEFYQIAQSGQIYPLDNMPDCEYGDELEFLRQMANNTVRYATSIKQAYDLATNTTAYPDNDLADQLAITARLIKGGLSTKIYLLEIGGFDTHANQLDFQPLRLQRIATGIKAFYDDLTAAGLSDKVLTMTFSEFGRTNNENASFGTDHGQAAPLLTFGGNTIGGLKGTFAALSSESSNDQDFTTDYRAVYATILTDWFGLNSTVVNGIMGSQFDIVPNLLTPTAPTIGSNDLAVLLGHDRSLDLSNTLLIKYAILRRGIVRLQILNNAGQVKATLVNTTQDAGSYTVSFTPMAYNLPPGDYIYRLETGGKTYSRRVLLNY